MEKKKNRFWLRLLGLVMLIIISFGEAISVTWTRFRRKWAMLK